MGFCFNKNYEQPLVFPIINNTVIFCSDIGDTNNFESIIVYHIEFPPSLVMLWLCSSKIFEAMCLPQRLSIIKEILQKKYGKQRHVVALILNIS